MSLSTDPAPTARRERTRLRLLEAAVAVFGERGVGGASVEEICERAGFTRGAFYSNFDSKDALCLAVLAHRHSKQVASAQAAIDATLHAGDSATLPWETVLAAAVDTFVDSQRDDLRATVTWVELRLHAIRTPGLREAYAAQQAESRMLGCTMIRSAVELRGARLTVSAEELGSLLEGVMESAVLDAALLGDAELGAVVKRRTILVLSALIVAPD